METHNFKTSRLPLSEDQLEEVLMELTQGLSGRWLTNYLTRKSEECVSNAIGIIPHNLHDLHERDAQLSSARALRDLITELPGVLKNQLSQEQVVNTTESKS